MSELDDYNAYQKAVADYNAAMADSIQAAAAERKAIADRDVAIRQYDADVTIENAAIAVILALLAKYIPEPVPPPTISIGQDKTALVGETVSFSAAVDGGKAPLMVAWDFGDQTAGAGMSTAHAYAFDGDGMVSATVTDALGRTATDTLEISVTKPPPPPPPPPAEVWDGSKLISNVLWKDNNDGTFTFTWDHFPATEDYRVVVEPTDLRTVPTGEPRYQVYWTKAEKYLWTPTAADQSWLVSNPGKNRNFALSVAAYKNKVSNKGGNGGTFNWPDSGPAPQPPGPPNPGPGPVPLPPPLPTMDRETVDVLLLPASRLNKARDLASKADQQWANFNAQLEGQLSIVLQSDYQASHLYWIAMYALGYRIFKANYPERARAYADKAIAIMISAMRDYLKGPKASVQFLARGDGVTKTFTIPNADFMPATFRAFLAPITKVTMTRTGPVTYPVPYGKVDFDESGGLFYSKILSATGADGTIYQENVDWRKTADIHNNDLDWSLPGKKPAKGEQYVVEVSSGTWNSVETVVDRGTIGFTFRTPPAADQSIWVEYMYGTSSADGSTLGYQQTHAGDGGFNMIEIDATYNSRNALFLALGFAWLEDYPGFSPALKAEAAGLLIRWADFLPVYGYLRDAPASNYGAAHYLLRVLAGAALAKFDPVNSKRILQSTADWRTKFVVPALSNPTGSLKGGFWAEGDNYGPGGRKCLILAGMALEQAGYCVADLERQWCTESILYFVHARPTPTTIYDGGDWFAWPAPLPGNMIFSLLAAYTPDVTVARYANKIIQQPGRANDSDWIDILYRDSAAPTADWTSEPLQYYASGTGLLLMRDSWEAAA